MTSLISARRQPAGTLLGLTLGLNAVAPFPWAQHRGTAFRVYGLRLRADALAQPARQAGCTPAARHKDEGQRVRSA